MSSPFSTGNRVKTLVARQDIDHSGSNKGDPSFFADDGINNGQMAARMNAADRVSRRK
jgi:hypothetical protein